MSMYRDNRCLIVDSNNQIARYTNVYTEAKNKDGLPIGGLFGMLQGVKKFLIANPSHTSVVFVVDAGVPEFRSKLCPEYKAQREGKRNAEQERIFQAYKAQVPHVRKVTRWTGCAFANAVGFEGDDVIAGLALKRFADRGVTIYASDKDYISLVDERVHLYDGITAEWRQADQDYFFSRLMDPKASDNLDGVRGIGKVSAALLISEARMAWEGHHNPATDPWRPYGKTGLQNFLNMMEYLTTGTPSNKQDEKIQKLAKKVVDAQEKMWANYKVTCMRRIAKRVDAATVLKVSHPDFDRFSKTTKEYGLRPILEDMTMMTRVFSRLDHEWLLEQQGAA